MTVEQLDARLESIHRETVRLRNELAEEEPDVEKAVALGAICAVETVLRNLLHPSVMGWEGSAAVGGDN